MGSEPQLYRINSITLLEPSSRSSMAFFHLRQFWRVPNDDTKKTAAIQGAQHVSRCHRLSLPPLSDPFRTPTTIVFEGVLPLSDGFRPRALSGLLRDESKSTSRGRVGGSHHHEGYEVRTRPWRIPGLPFIVVPLTTIEPPTISSRPGIS
jgi:hypothetical protein